MRKLRHILFAMLAVGALAGCRSQKGAIDTGSYVATDTPLAQRYADLCASYGEWTDVELPVRLDLTSPTRFGMNGKAYMKRGESVYISLRMMGIEVAVMQFDNDSVRLADKYHKKYIAEDISGLLKVTGLTITDLQDALLGRAFEIGAGTIVASGSKAFKMAEGPDGWALTPKNQPRGASYGFVVGLKDNAVSTLSIDIDGREPAVATYAHPLQTPAGTFSRDVTINAAFADQAVGASIEWDLRSARWDGGNTKQWKQPSASYQRIPAQQLLKSLRL